MKPVMRVCIMADDLTGALDSAAQFADSAQPLFVRWSGWREGDPGAAGLAIDTNTRDRPPGEASATVADMAVFLGDARLAFKKIDSLLRGHVVAEIAACLRTGRFTRCIVAPAFPYQGRVTVGGRQYVVDRSSGELGAPVGPNLARGFARAGLSTGVVPRGAALEANSEPVLVCDATDDCDLLTVAAAGGRLPERVLWCGTAGLAAALAGGAAPRPDLVDGPTLAVIGSPHPVSRSQVAHVARERPEIVVHLGAGVQVATRAIRELLERFGRAVLTLPPIVAGTDAEVQAYVAAALTEVVTRIWRPYRLIAAGGATLTTICAAIAADSLEVLGQLVPGVPVSIARGGPWDGVQVISKSGAFGAPSLLGYLLDGSAAARPSDAI
ncbi:MAG: hypothetical protein KJZ83_02485 [Burkholderiaceae bacterium]|nr:hypothetical protein [Burkholderiaceae bacterium]